MEIHEEFIQDYGITGLNVTRHANNGMNELSWRSESPEITNYVVIFGTKRKAVSISNNEELKEALVENSALLKNNRTVVFESKSYGTITCSYLNFVDLRTSKFIVPSYPGYYMVYGCKINDNEITELYNGDGDSNSAIISVTFDVVKEKVYTEKKRGFLGLLKSSERVYSGYIKITVGNGYPGIGAGIIKYNCNKNRSVFSVPQKILESKNGGAFYIKVPEEEPISIFTNNTDTVRLNVKEG